MNKSAFQLLKNNADDNEIAWVKNMLFVEYARVVQVIDVTTVRVQLLAQYSRSPKLFVVRLLNTGSNALREDVVQPAVDDQVLLLFLRVANQSIFNSPKDRRGNNGAGSDDPTVFVENATGYSAFSGVGILAATAKGRSSTSTFYGEDATGPFISAQTSAKLMKAFKNAVSVVFDVPLTDPASPPADAPVQVSLESFSPLEIDSRRGATVAFGGNVAVSSETGLLLEYTGDPDDAEDPLSMAISSSGLIIDTGDRAVSVDAGSANMDLAAAELHFNGDGKRLVTWDELNTALQGHIHASGTLTAPPGTAGGPVTGATGAPVALDISSAKTTTLKTGG